MARKRMIMVNTKLSAGNTNSFLLRSTTDTEHRNNIQLRFSLFMAKLLQVDKPTVQYISTLLRADFRARSLCRRPKRTLPDGRGSARVGIPCLRFSALKRTLPDPAMRDGSARVEFRHICTWRHRA